MKYSNVISAEFVSRPNRFIAEVMAGGERVRAHVKIPADVQNCWSPARRYMFRITGTVWEAGSLPTAL